MDPISDIQAAIQSGIDQNLAKAFRTNSDREFIVLPPGATLKDIPNPRLPPDRIQQKMVVKSAASFVDYVNRFSDDHSLIMVDVEKRQFTAVLDYHHGSQGMIEETDARHGEHTATFACPLTPEAATWLKTDKQKMTQVEFANFIETNALEIIEPQGAAMLELVQTFHAKTKVEFKGGINLTNGNVQLTFNEETVSGAGVQGTLAFPQKIKLALVIFQGDTQAFAVEANLRYRVAEGKLQMWYELIRPHRALETAVNEIKTAIVAGLVRGTVIDAAL